jgi:hypothetical protein
VSKRRFLKQLASRLGEYMQRTKSINRVLRGRRNRLQSGQSGRQPFLCQYCGARFADKNELLAHLEAEKPRDQTAPEPGLAAPFDSAGKDRRTRPAMDLARVSLLERV